MKTYRFLLLILVSFFLSPCTAQTVTADNFDQLQLQYRLPELTIDSRPFDGQKTSVMNIDGYPLRGLFGAPALPMRTDIVAVPFCDSIVIEVANAVFDTVDLGALVPWPLQSPRSKADVLPPEPIFDTLRYATDEYYGFPLASVDISGIARDRRLASITFSPVQINPVSHKAIVCRSADITLRYIGSDRQATLSHYYRLHSPAFNVPTLNNLFSTKDPYLEAPLRMVVIVPNSLRCSAIARLINWKRSCGIDAEALYFDMSRTNNEAIADSLADLYNNPSGDGRRAPTFIILVGDHEQLPAFDSKLSSWGTWGNDHISDLYYTTWSAGDLLPDAYVGRFSATDTATVAAIVDKTILYESYSFEDPSYLADAILISGVDNGYGNDSWDNAWCYADPSMDYVSSTYINVNNGYNTVYYYKNNTDHVPAGVTVSGSSASRTVATELRNLYNRGIGFVNYSAHGDWDRWHTPSFTVTHVNSMTNTGKPSFMIGNCCLSSKFDKRVCFAEALLRQSHGAGAVAYIGATNSTLWEQDFYWTVGVRSSIYNLMDATYDPDHLGMYDRLIHSHDEAYSDRGITAASMIFSGNLSVESATGGYYNTSETKQYYWEIYNLMGDPSLIPWLGTADPIPFTPYADGSYLGVTTVPNAYVSVIDRTNFGILAAGFASDNGSIELALPENFNPADTFYSAIAQGYRPLNATYTNVLDIPTASPLSSLSIYPNPSNGTIHIDGIPQNSTLQILDLTGRQLLSLGTERPTLSTQLLPGIYLLRIQTPTDIHTEKIIITQ